ncbi:8-amino-7-oxononanoate synthase [Shimazuella sp. AN120528]|uniref:8-amino-7-oxononanoate synthase n=1 Tax=Shimazuella soli TaxID=1892854 RepID=UPI001F0F9041|nr:8-amino-7-oxononanoate synthase [Shimazuella soli]MCH5585220.1 8-amino-7-oxononanoate synthase [Shimazuella soli]
MKNWELEVNNELHQLADKDLMRELKITLHAANSVCMRDGKKLLNFSSNNYLGLAKHPLLIQAMQKAEEAGSPSSRLLVGHEDATHYLEEQLAKWQQAESALVFSNGYMANLGVLSAFLNSRDAVFSDQFNHASIVDGIRLSGARSFRYRHNNMNHLESLLQRASKKNYRRKLIVTDAVFSMDGDIAPLREIILLKEKYGAALFVDEAHSVGTMGPLGRGLAHHLGIADQVDLHMGTFSKAFGVYGAYVTAKKDWIRYLINTSRSFIYTTALPPCIIAAIIQSLKVIQKSDKSRHLLHRKSMEFRSELTKYGFDTANSSTQIVPIVIGDSFQALTFSQKLMEKGVLAVAIRPPTVPVDGARLRFSLMSSHREEDIQKAIKSIIQIGNEYGVIR